MLSEQIVQAALEATGVLVVVTNFDNGVVVGVSDSVTRLTQIPADEMVGRPVWETMMDPVDGERLRLEYDDPTGAALLAVREGHIVTRDGDRHRILWTHVPLDDARGRITHVVMTGADARGEARGHGLLGHLLDVLAGVACVATDLRGRITFFSQGAERMLRRTADSVLGEVLPLAWFSRADLEARAHEQGREVSLEVVTLSAERRRRVPIDLGDLERRGTSHVGIDVLPSAVSPWSTEWTLVPRDGERFPAAVSVHPIMSNGQHVGWLGVAEDVRERDRTYEVLRLAVERERHGAEHLREVDRVVRSVAETVSHELRTPLASLSGYAEMLLDGEAGELSAEQQAFTEAIARNSDRLTTLTEGLLVIAGLESRALEVRAQPLDLRAVVASAVAAAAPEDAFSPEVDLPPNPLVVTGDEHRLVEALTELLVNSARFSSGVPDIRCSVSATGPWAVIEVTDRGIGFASEDVPWLFTPFYRSPEARRLALPGVGLGLTMVAAVVRAHGGTVEGMCSSQGTTFVVKVPLALA